MASLQEEAPGADAFDALIRSAMEAAKEAGK